MSKYYFAETTHPRGNLLIGALLHSEANLNALVARAMRDLGLAPGEDELSTGIPSAHHPILAPLAARYRELLRKKCTLGLVVLPADHKLAMGTEALKCLARLIQASQDKAAPHDAYFPKGTFSDGFEATRLTASLHPLSRCRLHFEQRSKRVLGLQLARFASHACGVRLTECLGLATRASRPIGFAEVNDYLFESISLSADCDDNVHFALQTGFGLMPESLLN